MKSILPTCACALLLASCIGPASPTATLRDPEAGELARMQAVDGVNDVKLLWRVAMGNAPFPVRQAAAKKVWALDEAQFWKKVEGDCKQIEGVMWKWICKEAGERKEKRALRAMVLRWGVLDVNVAEKERSEREAVAKISGVRPEEFLVAVIEEKELARDGKAQEMAFLAAARLWRDNHDQSHELTEKIPQTTSLHNTFPALAFLDALPEVEEELDILKVQSRLADMSKEKDNLFNIMVGKGVAARHLPLLRRIHVDSCIHMADYGADRTDHIVRTTDAPLINGTSPHPEDWDVCEALYAAIHTDSVARSLFTEADRDLSDTKTEHGGLLFWNDKNEVLFEAIPAVSRRHDQTYLPPESLFVKLRDGLAHVHFHAQKYNNGEYAGPGKGDLLFSENNRVNAVVFTFIDQDTLNADAYFPGKIVVDLGCIKRQK